MILPSLDALFSAASRLVKLLSAPSTKAILQFWQVACTVSTSRAISTSHPVATAEPGGAPMLTFLKQPVLTVEEHLGRTGMPKVVLYFFRSL